MTDRHYLDHASTSPLRSEAADAIGEWIQQGHYADPGRIYAEGREARDVVELARTEIADLFHVRERQIIFTGSGTEAINTVNSAVRSSLGSTASIACALVEHSAVRLSAQRSGNVVDLSVDRLGRIDVDSVRDALSAHGDQLAMVHCQFANHEVSTLQSVAEIVTLCRDAGVAVHVDACAAAGQLALDLEELGADFVSLSAHKFGGPPGIGVLVLGRRRRIPPFIAGGEQERGRRAGFENVLGIVGLGAVARAIREKDLIALESKLARERTERMLAAALAIEGVTAYGDTERRAPHIICVGIEGVEAEGVVLGLDQAGVAVHSGSACSSESFEPSPVLAAMGVDAERSLRCSVGWSTTEDDVIAFVDTFPVVVASLRELRN